MASRSGFQNLRDAAEERIQLQARLIAAQIEDLNQTAVISAQRMAEAQVAGMFGDRETSLEYARKVLEDFDGITGAYFGYEPNADGKDAESLGKLPAEAMDPNGRFIPYWFVASSQNVERSNWNRWSIWKRASTTAAPRTISAKTGKPAAKVTEPYVYQGKMITEQVYPIVIDGEFKGVAGVDFALADIEAKLRRIAAAEGLDIFLISSQGNFIAATTDPLDGDGESGGSGIAQDPERGGCSAAADLFRQIDSRQTTLAAPLLEVDPHRRRDDTTSPRRPSRPAIGRSWSANRKALVLAPIWSQLRHAVDPRCSPDSRRDVPCWSR